MYCTVYLVVQLLVLSLFKSLTDECFSFWSGWGRGRVGGGWVEQHRSQAMFLMMNVIAIVRRSLRNKRQERMASVRSVVSESEGLRKGGRKGAIGCAGRVCCSRRRG